MAEIASHADHKTTPGPRRQQLRRAEAAALTAPLRTDATAARFGVRTRRDAVTTESAVDRYAFYFFMGTIALGILAMIVLAFTI